MINLKVENGQIRCDVFKDTIISEEYFPLKLKITRLISNKIVWETELNPGMWATWPAIRDYNAHVFTNNGILLKELTYHYTTENLQIYEFWDYFCKINKKSIGLILGCGDGTWGEWVSAVNENKIECHLVEGSEKTFNDLKYTYEKNSSFKLHNILVTSDGRNCDFYEGDHHDGLNTINYEYLRSIDPSAKSNFKSKSSTSIENLLNKIGKIDWIRIDLEGSDYEIIKSIPNQTLNSLIMLQYEHLGLLQEKRDDIDSIMIPMGFKKLQYEIDTIYFK